MDQEKLFIHPKRAKGEDGYKTFSIRVKEEVVERINGISARTGHSSNELIGMFLEFALDRCTLSENEQA